MISVIIRTVTLYITVTAAIRLMGKRQIGDMQPNELVITLLISEIAAIPLQDKDQPVINGIVAVFLLVVLEICVSALTLKSFNLRKILSGKSVIIIKNGTVDQQAMRDVRMTTLDLIELLRGQNVFNIEDVSFAVLESNGNLSVLLKADRQPATAGQLNVTDNPAALPLPAISDGKIISESLDALSVTSDDIRKIIKNNGGSIKNVFLMTLDRNGNYNVINTERGV
ncbi:MAG: DUF421 domain-containing protein [Clostridia bacterium]|nr:DUF421 domain-containing protein [Clostridia bacterium]